MKIVNCYAYSLYNNELDIKYRGIFTHFILEKVEILLSPLGKFESFWFLKDFKTAKLYAYSLYSNELGINKVNLNDLFSILKDKNSTSSLGKNEGKVVKLHKYVKMLVSSLGKNELYSIFIHKDYINIQKEIL